MNTHGLLATALPAQAATALSGIPGMRLAPPLETLPEEEPAPAPPVAGPHAAKADSPVGRIVARLAADPRAACPLTRLEERIGRPLVNLGDLTDLELHAVTARLLAERHRRDSRWMPAV